MSEEPLGIEELAALIDSFVKPVQYRLECHPIVLEVLKSVAESEGLPSNPIPDFQGTPAQLAAMTIHVKPDMEWGSWRVLADGELVLDGRTEIPEPDFRPADHLELREAEFYRPCIFCGATCGIHFSFCTTQQPPSFDLGLPNL